MEIEPTAWKFFLPLAVISICLILLGAFIPAGLVLLVALWVLWFFRDPVRIPPSGEDLLLAPADGRIDTLEEVEHAAFPGGKAIKLGIFLSIFDVHINRAPCRGRVKETRHKRGRFLSAMNRDSSHENESNLIVMDTEAGPVHVKQIAGMIARRIVCPLKRGDDVYRGDKIGMICFGSRTEIFLPLSSRICVRPGMKVAGGETILGRLEPEEES